MKINKIKQLLPALISMGMTFIVLGVLMLAASFVFGIKNNILLFAGLFFIVAGTEDMYIRSSKSLSLVTEKLLIPR